MAIPGFRPILDQQSGGGGEKEALPFRPCPPDAAEVGGEGRCHVWTVVPQAQIYPTVPIWQ